ncbi:hypothetical protein JCM16814_28360 [Desulfobaculum senezii]
MKTVNPEAKIEGVLETYDETVERLAAMWSAYLQRRLTTKDVENMLTMLSMSRGVKILPVEEITEHPIVALFWADVERIVNEHDLDVSSEPKEIAFHMQTVKKHLIASGWSERDFNKARKLLGVSPRYKLLEKNRCRHNSKLYKTQRCWCFLRPQEDAEG